MCLFEIWTLGRKPYEGTSTDEVRTVPHIESLISLNYIILLLNWRPAWCGGVLLWYCDSVCPITHLPLFSCSWWTLWRAFTARPLLLEPPVKSTDSWSNAGEHPHYAVQGLNVRMAFSKLIRCTVFIAKKLLYNNSRCMANVMPPLALLQASSSNLTTSFLWGLHFPQLNGWGPPKLE